MKIEFCETVQTDLDYVVANPFKEAVKEYPAMTAPENSWTCFFDGEIVAVGGVKLYFPGVGESWVIMTKQSRKSGVFGLIACRAISDKLDSIAAELHLRRCEANVREDFDTGIRFVEAIGFTFDGRRERWFPNYVTSLLYSKVYDVHE